MWEAPSPFFWPFVFSAALVTGIVLSLLCLKYSPERSQRDVVIKAFLATVNSPEPAALAEATIAICSGALLWIGFWDFLDTYLIPNAWWAKLAMFGVGALGALWTRSLYVVDTARHSSREVVHAIEDGIDNDGPPPLVEVLSPRKTSFGQPSEDDDDRLSRTSKQRNSREDFAERDAACRCCCLNPPPFSASRCARALLATFSGLTMWVGLWDLIETHMLPTLFTSCQHEPNWGCALAKLGLVFVGAVGLYLTRSLYGENGHSVQFQRL